MNTSTAHDTASEASVGLQGVPWAGLMGVLLATFTSTLNGRLSQFGLNDIRGAMHVGFDEGAWISTAQTVAQMLVAPFAVWLGRVFGPRRVLLNAALAFAFVSAVKPLSPNLECLLALQFLGGVASGFFVPLTVGYIVRSLAPRFWAYGIALYGLNIEFSLNISASLEGWYVDCLSWHWIFWQNVPLALGMVVFLHYGVRTEPISPEVEKVDVFGLASSGAGLALIYAALDQGDRLDWFGSGLICALIVSGALLLVAFVIHERNTADPFLDLEYVTKQPFPQILSLTVFLRLTVLATSFVIPQFLATVRGFRAIETGQTLVWIAVPQLLVCIICGVALRRVDARLVGCYGMVLMCAACLIVAHGLTPEWGWPEFLATQLMQAVGQTLATTGVIFYGILNLKPKDAITFGAMAQVARLMGGEIGQAFITTFIRVRTQTASNLIGQHVQRGDADVIKRLQGYAAATARAGDPMSGMARGARLLSNVIHRLATTQAVIDSFVVIAFLAALALIVLVTARAAPNGPASPKPLFVALDVDSL